MHKPLVTVLLPNYNNESFLKEAIDSILNQTFTNFEFLIVDDGSTDSSVDIVNSYSDHRIRLILKEKNSGIVDTLNLGIEKAVGEYMIRMDGDDISSIDRIEKLVNFLDKNPTFGACGSALKNFGLINGIWSYNSDPLINKAKVLFGNPFGHATTIFRLNIWKKNGIKYRNGYPYVEDIKLFSELNSITLLGSIPNVLYYYRRLPTTSTIANKDTIRNRVGTVHQEILSQLLSRDPSKEELHLHFNYYRAIYDRPLKNYYLWSKTLIKANQIRKIYPVKELKIVIDKRFEKIKFKALDCSYLNIFNILKYELNIQPRFIRYLISKIFKVNE